MFYPLLSAIAAAAAIAANPSETQLSRREQDAHMYYAEGEYAREDGDLKVALPFYRAALRLVPDSMEYLRFIGTIEYQLGYHRESRKRFAKMLKLDAESTVARYFLKLNDKKLGRSGGDNRVVCEGGSCAPVSELPVDVIHCANCKIQPRTFGDYANHPFVIRRLLYSMDCNFDAFTTHALNHTYGRHIVDFYPQNMVTKPNKVYTVPFRKALDYLEYPEGAYLSVDASEAGTYIQWNMNQSTWDTLLAAANIVGKLPAFLSRSMDKVFDREEDSTVKTMDVEGDETTADDMEDDRLQRIKHDFGYKTHWYMLLVGEEGSGMFPHQDTLPVGSWQAQVAGSKRWRLCSPESTAMQPASQRDADRAESSTPSGPSQCYETVLQKGDLIYYPPDFWHETLNLETPTMALSGTVVDGNRVAFISALQEECRTDEKGFGFDRSFCDLIR